MYWWPCASYVQFGRFSGLLFQLAAGSLDLPRIADQRVDRITVQMVLAWRRSVPELSRWHETKCVRQVLHFAVAHGYVASNVATFRPLNPPPATNDIGSK